MVLSLLLSSGLGTRHGGQATITGLSELGGQDAENSSSRHSRTTSSAEQPDKKRNDVEARAKEDYLTDLHKLMNAGCPLQIVSGRCQVKPQDFITAIVPDPRHTHLALQFDRTVDAIEEAAGDEGYIYDRDIMPWDPKAHSESDEYATQWLHSYTPVYRWYMLPNYHYSYVVGVLIFWVAWVACSILGKAYRSEIRWGTVIAAPLALTSLLFVPQYWTPPSLFNLDQRIRVGIEDFLWAAAVGGIASVVGEIFLRDGLAVIRKSRHKRHYAPFVLVVVVFIALHFWLHWKTMNATILSFAAGALVLAYLRRDLVALMVMSAVSFTVLYFVLFSCVLFLYPQFVERYYNRPNLLGIYILKVPIEELLFAATGGALWSVANEYVFGYRLEAAGRI